MPALAEVAREKLQKLEGQGRKRALAVTHAVDGVFVERGAKRMLSFGGNDYLGLSQHPQVKAAAIAALERYGTGAGASRLVTGNHALYAELETKLAAWKGAEAALVFGSGYLTNSGVIPALVGKGDLILADRLVHACLLDGALLSGAKLHRFRHNDIEDCGRLLKAARARHRHCLIVTDEVFSMDGDLAPIAQLRALADRHDAWLMADGAHSIGLPHAEVDIYTGTLSKALGGYGGYVCGSQALIAYLATSARSFMFSTGLPPSVIAGASAALDVIAEIPDLVHMPLAKARLFTQKAGLPLAQSPIVPLVLGDEAKALAAAAELEAAGYYVSAIRPPTVPENTSRLRFAFSALHADADIVRLGQFVNRKGSA